MIKLSCTDNMVPGNSLTEKAHTLRKLGYDGMAIFCGEPDFSEELFDEIRHLRENTGIAPCEFVFTDGVYGRLMDQDPAIRAEAIRLYKHSIAVANEVGAITEMEYQYRTQDPLPLFEPYLPMPESEQLLYISIIETLGATVADGAWMLIEPCNRYETKYLTRLCDCQELLERADPKTTKNMGLLADFFHMAIEEADIEKSIEASGKWIHHVHLGDSNRLAPGYGHTDWVAGMRALKKIGFDGYMNLECKIPGPYDQKLPEIAAFLKETIRKA